MVSVCPRCKSYIGFTLPPRVEGLKLRCSACNTVFRIVRKDPSPSPSVAPAASGRVTVLVANDQPEFCARVANTLPEDAFSIVFCNDGNEALDTIERLKPDVAVIDVSLPGMFGFEVCEAVRRNPLLGTVRLILLAELRDHRKYTRSPASLYGADASVDKLVIENELERVIRGLVPLSRFTQVGEPRTREQQDAPVENDDAVAAPESAAVDAKSIADAFPEPLSAEQVKAQRLARLIVSDIALYNRQMVEEGVLKGTFYELLADDIREGRALYEKRVSQSVRESTSFLDDAFSDLIARKKQELNRS